MLARAPSAPGKTRLTATLADEAAIALRRALLLDTYDAVHAAGADVIVAFTPDDARDEFEMLHSRSGPALMPQRGGDLGARMHAALSDAFARGADRVVLVGSDLPSLPTAYLTEAFAGLEAHDVALGPSEDGGYYLIGMRTPHEALFTDIAWGSARVFEQTLTAAKALGLSVAQVPSWFDVDTEQDLARLGTGGGKNAARHTRKWLSRRRRHD
jgi:rSAM/selenodomain-associated transferase 1